MDKTKEYISNITLPNGETKYIKDSDLTSSVEELSKRVSTNETTISNVKTKADTTESNLNDELLNRMNEDKAIHKRIDETNTTLETTKSQVTTNQENILTNTNQISTNKADILAIKNNISRYEVITTTLASDTYSNGSTKKTITLDSKYKNYIVVGASVVNVNPSQYVAQVFVNASKDLNDNNVFLFITNVYSQSLTMAIEISLFVQEQ